MEIITKILPKGEYYEEVTPKNTIYWHHTAGGHNPSFVIDGWQFDKNKAGGQLKVATSFIIGGLSTFNNETKFDGQIWQCFDDKYWAHHLGTTQVNNVLLNQQSIGIEVCNYGPLVKNALGQFVNYIGKPIPENMVTTLSKPFRGYIYYHKYTDAQILSLKQLTQNLAIKYNINLKLGLQQFINDADNQSAFEINQAALKGMPGLWSHTNVLQSKFDIYPDPRLIELIKQF